MALSETRLSVLLQGRLRKSSPQDVLHGNQSQDSIDDGDCGEISPYSKTTPSDSEQQLKPFTGSGGEIDR